MTQSRSQNCATSSSRFVDAGPVVYTRDPCRLNVFGDSSLLSAPSNGCDTPRGPSSVRLLTNTTSLNLWWWLVGGTWQLWWRLWRWSSGCHLSLLSSGSHSADIAVTWGWCFALAVTAGTSPLTSVAGHWHLLGADYAWCRGLVLHRGPWSPLQPGAGASHLRLLLGTSTRRPSFDVFFLILYCGSP